MKKFITIDDVRQYANVSKDTADIHLDLGAAIKAGFNAPIVHGMYLMGLAQSYYLQAHPNDWISHYEMYFKKPMLVDCEALFTFQKQGNVVHIFISTVEQVGVALGTLIVKEWDQ